MKKALFSLLVAAATVWPQEAETGFELRTTLTTGGILSGQLEQPPRSGAPATAGARAILYPTWRISSNWTASAAVQIHSRPYFVEQFTTQGHGVRSDILRADLSYSHFWNQNSLVFRAGQLPTAFGSFLLRYDDADNALVDMPLSYGYYYKSVSTYGMPGAQIDVTFNRLDARAQFVNSSPANRRGVFDSDQYGNWAGGVGYTIVQGFRIGASGYRGPYLHRQYAFYRPGEARPRDLPASGVGLDVQWARGHWNSHGEWQRFARAYRMMPTFRQEGGYAETRRVLHPRWYAAARIGYLKSSIGGTIKAYETSIGFRPNRHQLMKFGYQYSHSPKMSGFAGSTFAVQLVTSFRPVALAGK
jgi:hypothetical protein